jgi:hypothetical protein
MLVETRTKGVVMKSTDVREKEVTGLMSLADNRVLTVRGRGLRIECRQGLLWVTWPESQERVLIPGSSLPVASKGRICVQAMGDSVVAIERRRWWSGLAAWVSLVRGMFNAGWRAGPAATPVRGLPAMNAKPTWRL